MEYLLSSHSQQLPSAAPEGSVPEWIQILPKGVFPGRDGRGPYSCDPERVASATRAHFGSADVPLDYDHQLEFATKNGRPAPASGWVRELSAREDGLWARVDWTEKARAHIAAREYRYVSPVFFHSRKSGEILRLDSVSLTNLPNLSMKALAAQDRCAAKLQEEPMSLTALRATFGLAEAATEEQVLAHARQLQNEAALAKAAQAKAECELNDVKKELAAQTSADPDPAKYVPLSVLHGVTAELSELKAKAAKETAAGLVAEGVSAGKISPAMKPWAEEYAAKDPDGFKAYMSQAPALVGGQEAKAGASAKAPGDGSALNATEKAVCRSMGIAEDDYLKARAAMGRDEEDDHA